MIDFDRKNAQKYGKEVKFAYNNSIEENMSEITIVISKKKFHWISGKLSCFFKTLINSEVSVSCNESPETVMIILSFEKNDKNKVLHIIKEFLCETYCSVAKREYLEKVIPKSSIEKEKRETLIRALVSFDGENDRKIVLSSLKIERIFNIDGFYNFRLRALQREWEDLSMLARENLQLSQSKNYTVDLLLRFLLGAITPINETVRICYSDDGYRIFTPQGTELSSCLSEKELLDGLVDIAPIEIICDETITSDKLTTRLNSIFDIKRVNNLLYFGENKH